MSYKGNASQSTKTVSGHLTSNSNMSHELKDNQY